MESPVFEICFFSGSYISIPEKIVMPFIKKNIRRVIVNARYQEKNIRFHAALQKRKGGYLIMFGKRLQKTLDVYPNDYFTLQFFEDTSKYGVEMPEEFDAVLQSDPEAFEIFESLTDGKKRGLIYHILKIKSPQIRIDKALTIIENLKYGIRDQRELVKKL